MAARISSLIKEEKEEQVTVGKKPGGHDISGDKGKLL